MVDIISYLDEDKANDMTLESKSSTTNPFIATYTSMTTMVIDRYDKFESTEKLLKDNYDNNIDHNFSEFLMIR